MWKSKEKKRKEELERALAEMPHAAEQVAEKWRYFTAALVFKDDVPLAEQIRSFSFPLADFFRSAYPNISKTDPMVYMSALLIGIYLAKTHPIPEVLKAARRIEDDSGIEGIEALVTRFVRRTPNF